MFDVWQGKVFAQLEEVFLPPGTGFLRRNFPNIEEDFPNIEEKFS